MKSDNYVKLMLYLKTHKNIAFLVKLADIICTGLIYLSIILMALYMLINKDARLIRLVLVLGLSFAAVSVFRHYYNAPRPYSNGDFKPVIKKENTGESMPSRHVFSAFIIATSFLYLKNPMYIILYICATILAVVRVIAGLHYPKDVAVGALVGVLCGVIGFFLI